MLFRTRAGIPWRDPPERYGTWPTVYERHRRWSAGGTWDRIVQASRADAASTRTGWAVNIDSAAERAHQHAAGARRRAPVDHPKKGAGCVAAGGREALGRSRGGLTTKIHLLADDRCRPLVIATSPGQRGDAPMFVPVLEALRITHRGPGRPRTRPDRCAAIRPIPPRPSATTRGTVISRPPSPAPPTSTTTAGAADASVGAHRPSTTPDTYVHP